MHLRLFTKIIIYILRYFHHGDNAVTTTTATATATATGTGTATTTTTIDA